MGSSLRAILGRVAIVAGVLVLSLAAGVAVEVAAGKLDRISWWLMFYILIGLLLASVGVAVGFAGRRSSLFAILPAGVLAGATAFVVFALGVFLPFAAGLGGRDLDKFGGDLDIGQSLLLLLGGSAMIGALLGVFAGVVGWWALKPRGS